MDVPHYQVGNRNYNKYLSYYKLSDCHTFNSAFHRNPLTTLNSFCKSEKIQSENSFFLVYLLSLYKAMPQGQMPVGGTTYLWTHAREIQSNGPPRIYGQ